MNWLLLLFFKRISLEIEELMIQV